MIMGLLLLVSTLTGSVDGIVLYRLAVLLSHCLQNFQYGAFMWVRSFCISPGYAGQGAGHLRAWDFLLIKFACGPVLQHSL
jgi:hypothetical protein